MRGSDTINMQSNPSHLAMWYKCFMFAVWALNFQIMALTLAQLPSASKEYFFVEAVGRNRNYFAWKFHQENRSHIVYFDSNTQLCFYIIFIQLKIYFMRFEILIFYSKDDNSLFQISQVVVLIIATENKANGGIYAKSNMSEKYIQFVNCFKFVHYFKQEHYVYKNYSHFRYL